MIFNPDDEEMGFALREIARIRGKILLCLSEEEQEYVLSAVGSSFIYLLSNYYREGFIDKNYHIKILEDIKDAVKAMHAMEHMP
jgi:hypothetical protein